MKNIKTVIAVAITLALVIMFCSRPKVEQMISMEKYNQLQLKYDNLTLEYLALKDEKVIPVQVGYVTNEQHEQILKELLDCRMGKLEANTTTYTRKPRPVLIKTDTSYNTTAAQLEEFYTNVLDDVESRLIVAQDENKTCQTKLVQAEIDKLRDTGNQIYKGTITTPESQIIDYVAEVQGKLVALDAKVTNVDIIRPIIMANKVRNNYLGVEIFHVWDTDNSTKPGASLEYLNVKKPLAWGLRGGARFGPGRNDIAPQLGIKLGITF